MRRFIISFFSILILYLFQNTVFPIYLNLSGITPNLLLMFTCIVGFMRGRKSGMLTGFFSGLLLDIMSGGIIGFTALLYLYAGFLNGVFHKEYTKEQLLLPLGLVAFCDISYGFLFYVIHYLMRNRLDFGYYLSRTILPEMAYTVLVTIFAYIIVYYTNRKLDFLGKKRQAKDVRRKYY